MSIKSFYVKTERIDSKVEGLIKYTKYLEDYKDPRHANNEIIKIHNLGRNFFNICNKNASNLDYQNSEKGGRKVQSYAQSFDFSFPPSVEVSEEDYKELSEKLINVLKEILPNLEENEVFMNVHKNLKVNFDESPGHLNLLVSRVSYDKKLKKYTNNLDLDKFKVLGKLKKEFNLFIVNKYQLSPENYVPKKHKQGTNVPLWAARKVKNEEVKEEITKNEVKLNEIKKEINNIENGLNILTLSKNDLEIEVNNLIKEIGNKEKKATDLTDLIKKSNSNANKKFNKIKEEVDKLKKEKEYLKEFEEKINQSNLAKIIDNASTFINIVKEKFTKHKTITKLINDFENEITKQATEIFNITNEKEEIKTNNIENIRRINDKNTKEKEKIEKDFNEKIELKDQIIEVLEKEIKKIDPNNKILKKIIIK
jgi:hypothetical protein